MLLFGNMSCIYKNNVKAQISGFALDTPNTKDGVIWYKIQVEINDSYWVIDRRYSDFEALHKKLVDLQGIKLAGKLLSLNYYTN